MSEKNQGNNNDHTTKLSSDFELIDLLIMSRIIFLIVAILFIGNIILVEIGFLNHYYLGDLFSMMIGIFLIIFFTLLYHIYIQKNQTRDEHRNFFKVIKDNSYFRRIDVIFLIIIILFYFLIIQKMDYNVERAYLLIVMLLFIFANYYLERLSRSIPLKGSQHR